MFSYTTAVNDFSNLTSACKDTSIKKRPQMRLERMEEFDYALVKFYQNTMQLELETG